MQYSKSTAPSTQVFPPPPPTPHLYKIHGKKRFLEWNFRTRRLNFRTLHRDQFSQWPFLIMGKDSSGLKGTVSRDFQSIFLGLKYSICAPFEPANTVLRRYRLRRHAMLALGSPNFKIIAVKYLHKHTQVLFSSRAQ